MESVTRANRSYMAGVITVLLLAGPATTIQTCVDTWTAAGRNIYETVTGKARVLVPADDVARAFAEGDEVQAAVNRIDEQARKVVRR